MMIMPQVLVNAKRNQSKKKKREIAKLSSIICRHGRNKYSMNEELPNKFER